MPTRRNFSKVVNTEAEMHQMQKAIDNLVKWSIIINKFNLNHSKTTHVTYHHKNNNKFTSQYYIGTNRILKSNQVQDLGVIFDETLTCKPHIESILFKINCIFGLGLRFVQRKPDHPI